MGKGNKGGGSGGNNPGANLSGNNSGGSKSVANVQTPLTTRTQVTSPQNVTPANTGTQFVAAASPTMVTFSTQQFDQLLSCIRPVTSPPPQRTPAVVIAQASSGTFAKCTARFNGSEKGDVESFLDAVLTFKDVCNVTDDNAVRGLSMLLEGQASKWWLGVKQTISTWNEAEKALRDAFSKKLPPHLVYREIFAREQKEDELTETFVCNVRSFFAQLPYTLPLAAQLDIVFGLLNRRIRKRLLRDEMNDFKELLTRARDVERSYQNPTTVTGKTAEIKNSNSSKSKSSPADEKGKDENKSNRLRPKCNFCKNFGHVEEDCRKRAAALTRAKDNEVTAPAPVNETDTQPKSPIHCYGCKTPGVIRSQCPKCKPSLLNMSELTFSQASFENTRPERPLLPITVQGFRGTGFADCGAQATIAGAKLYQILLTSGCEFSEEETNISFADGKSQCVKIRKTQVKVEIAGKQIPTTFIVLPHLSNNNTLLGCDFLARAKIILDIAAGKWFFRDDPGQTFNFLHEVAEQVDVDIASVSIRENEGVNLSPEEKSRLNSLLDTYGDVFKLGGEPTPFAVHRINTGNHPPVASKPYPISAKKKEFLRKELDRMLEDGVIEECESPYASPIVLVPKGESFRLCVDYRKLNQNTVDDSYPMPRIDDILHSAKSTAYMSTIDLQSGYWQVPVAEEDRDKTCFTCCFGTFRFSVMPFGLKNAPKTFSRLMDRFRAGLGDRAVSGLLDDAINISESFERHLEDLEAIFARLRLFKLRARREKCHFARGTVKFLGHLITPEGIKSDDSKVAAVVAMKQPQNQKQVYSFVQTCSWFRKFIPKFSEIARPLTNLLKKNQTFQFGEAEVRAFETLKKKLVEAPILKQADPTMPYILRTDASNFALGAALLQGEENVERVIEYASRLLLPAERNYAAWEREALAVVWATERFRTYLEGAEVIIGTDHQPLIWLFTRPAPPGRMARWIIQLQSLDMKLKYVPGKLNVLADLLSRPVCEHADEETCNICQVTIDLPSIGVGDFRKHQLEDCEIGKIIKGLESDDELELTRWTERGYLIANGILYRWDSECDNDDPQLVIPASHREEILRMHHDSPTGGHYGIERTIQKILSKYYFPNMRKYVTAYLKSCIDCQRYKISNLKPAGLLQTPVPAQRFETIAIDLFGPLPETAQGNKWIFILEDTASKWVELFSLQIASAEECAKVLINEIILRYGTPRRAISDNGPQFISDVMQKVTFCFDINPKLIPVYHPESNPVERKNRDLKPQLAILTQNLHNTWDMHIASIRFAMNSTVCSSTGYTPAYLTFGRELRTPADTLYDFREVVNSENFVPNITPYLKKLATALEDAKEKVMREQDRKKETADKSRRQVTFNAGQKVLLRTHVLSNAAKGITGKLAPKRDGPYVISKVTSPTTYELSTIGEPVRIIGRYHVSELTTFQERGKTDPLPTPLVPKRGRGRPPKHKLLLLDQTGGPSSGPEGECIT